MYDEPTPAREPGDSSGPGAPGPGEPPGPGAPLTPFDPGESLPGEFAFVPPDPDEQPPVELWSAVGDVQPWGTLLALFSWAIVFALQAARGELGDGTAMAARGANTVPHGALDGAWRLLASTFLHESPGHVFFNALALLVLGQATERIFAPGGFLMLYALGGAAASYASLAWRMHLDHASAGLSVGGSGVVFALGGALLVAAFRVRHQLAVGRARALGAVVLLLTMPGLAAGFQRHGIDNAAHAGGLVSGALLGALVSLREPLGGPRESRTTAALGVLSALAILAAFAGVLAS